MTLFVDPATAAPLPNPTQLPMSVDRRIQAVEDQSDGSTVLVEETIVERAGTLVDTTQRNAYVMDRRTMANLADGRAYAFDPANVVDRAGAYRVNLPFGVTTDSQYSIYQNETATTYELRSDRVQPTGEQAGLTVNNYTASASELPLTDAYLTELDKAVPLPRSLTLDQLKPQLLQYGVDIDALLPALTPVLTPTDLEALSTIASGAIPLRYVMSFEGRVAVEPTTGAQVHVAVNETIGARPELTTLPQLREILGHYPNVAQAVAADEGLGRLPSAPATKLIEIRYDQTPPSIADAGATISSQRTKAMAATWYIPGALLGLGLLALLAGGIRNWRGGSPDVIDLREAARGPAADGRAPSAMAEVPGPHGREDRGAPPPPTVAP